MLLRYRRHRRVQAPDQLAVQAVARAARDTWHMPPLSALTPPVWSSSRKIGMLTLRVYLLIAAALMIVKVVELALGR